MSPQDITLRLAVALILGSLIGFERQWHQKMAGLRTNALVALGAGGFVVFSAMYPTQSDPTRMAAQIVSGIGFLGAGIILREGVNVHGLNTAATLWCSAMVGTLAGGGFWLPSALAGGFVIVTNLLLRPLVSRLNRRLITSSDVETHYTVEVTCKGSARCSCTACPARASASGGSTARTFRTPPRSPLPPRRCRRRATMRRWSRSSDG
jgi:putative Mg2+ transporter-C (MgtC) family protein